MVVCSGNVHRSRAAEKLLGLLENLEVRSAGTLPLSPCVISEELIDWAEIVLVMEDTHRNVILQIRPEAKNKVFVLGIPDIYSSRDDAELIGRLKAKLSQYFGKI